MADIRKSHRYKGQYRPCWRFGLFNTYFEIFTKFVILIHLCVLHFNEILSLFLKIYTKSPSRWTHANSVSNLYWNTITYYVYLFDIKYLAFCMFYSWKKNRLNDLCNGLLNETISKSYSRTFVRNENNIWNYGCVLKTEKVNEKFRRNINGKEKTISTRTGESAEKRLIFLEVT